MGAAAPAQSGCAEMPSAHCAHQRTPVLILGLAVSHGIRGVQCANCNNYDRSHAAYHEESNRLTTYFP